MSRERFKSFVKEKVEIKADHAKRKLINYERLEMAEYMSSLEEDI